MQNRKYFKWINKSRQENRLPHSSFLVVTLTRLSALLKVTFIIQNGDQINLHSSCLPWGSCWGTGHFYRVHLMCVVEFAVLILVFVEQGHQLLPHACREHARGSGVERKSVKRFEMSGVHHGGFLMWWVLKLRSAITQTQKNWWTLENPTVLDCCLPQNAQKRWCKVFQILINFHLLG